MTLASLKQDFAKNRTKTFVLGVLVLVMAVLVGRLFIGSTPRAATAMSDLVVPVPEADPAAQVQIEQRLKQSRQLWQVLREKRGATPAETFLLDPAFYVRDASHISVPLQPRIEPITEKSPPKSVDEQVVAGRIAKLKEEASALHLQSTVMSETPLAVINSEILRVGEMIRGFRVVAIRARQVTLEKNGITLTLEMAK